MFHSISNLCFICISKIFLSKCKIFNAVNFFYLSVDVSILYCFFFFLSLNFFPMILSAKLFYGKKFSVIDYCYHYFIMLSLMRIITFFMLRRCGFIDFMHSVMFGVYFFFFVCVYVCLCVFAACIVMLLNFYFLVNLFFVCDVL
jgi:hypothetical protein